MFEVIRAALETDKKTCSIHLHCPDKNPSVVATSLLKEYKMEEKSFENLRHLDFPESKIPSKSLLRLERSLGVVPSREPMNPKNSQGHCCKGDKYLVIFDDCLYHNEKTKRQGEGYYENNYEDISQNLSCDGYYKYILWHPRRFGDHSLEEGHDAVFKKFIFNESSNKKVNNKKRTIVFLRADDLADAGIGQRGDCSLEECLDGILEAIHKNKEMQKLADCAALIIKNGVDSAFLIQFELTHEKDKEDRQIPNIKYCQVFFRTSRTDNAYRQSEGSIPGLGIYMVSSCLRTLIDTEKDVASKELLERLSSGIEDGLHRVLIRFCIGYLKNEKDEKGSKECLEDIYGIEQQKKKDECDEYKETKLLMRRLKKEDGEKKGDKPDIQKRKIRKYKAKKIIEITNRYYVHSPEPPKEKEKRVAAAAAKDSATYISHFFQYPGQPLAFLPPWLLEQQWRSGIPDKNFQTQNDFLDAIVRHGLRTLEEERKILFPVARFGEMEIVEPDEISMFRRIDSLMRKYIIDSETKKPLRLAVFGAPGSGKSRGIMEVAHSVNTNIKEIECNLAQFKEPDELYEKLLEARNLSKYGQIPIIFLDEFDTKFNKESFGWCKHLLSVLQDGTFRLRGTLYDLGKAIIVCAGGVYQSFREFEWKSKDSENEQESRDAKIPDFISRLQGYVDVAGPNPYFPYPLKDEKTIRTLKKLNGEFVKHKVPVEKRISIFHGVDINDWAPGDQLLPNDIKVFIKEDLKKLDPLYKIRRAVLLRSVLKEKMPFIYHSETKKINIGNKVLRALLDISEYKYGIRSMTAIIEMSVAVGRDSRRFTIAMLPPPEQLEMHVDAEEFYGYIAKVDK